MEEKRGGLQPFEHAAAAAAAAAFFPPHSPIISRCVCIFLWFRALVVDVSSGLNATAFREGGEEGNGCLQSPLWVWRQRQSSWRAAIHLGSQHSPTNRPAHWGHTHAQPSVPEHMSWDFAPVSSAWRDFYCCCRGCELEARGDNCAEIAHRVWEVCHFFLHTLYTILGDLFYCKIMLFFFKDPPSTTTTTWIVEKYGLRVKLCDINADTSGIFK